MGIALEYQVPMAAIQLVNHLGSETTVWVDQEITIPQSDLWAHASPFWSVYEVTTGDTLTGLASRFGVALEALLNANGLSDADLIAVGQPLILPFEAPTEVQVITAAPPAESETPPTPLPAPTMATVAEASAANSELLAHDEPSGEDGLLDTEVVDGNAPPPDLTPTSTPEPTAIPPAPDAPPAATANLASEIYRLINEQRAAHGLPPLAWNDTLARAAQLHADDCHARGWCGHTGSDGSSYKQRIIRAGYNPVRWSECWAWYATPQKAVAMWMDEVPPNDPHRRTILSDYLLEVGVGVVPGNGHGYYFIADFGTPGN